MEVRRSRVKPLCSALCIALCVPLPGLALANSADGDAGGASASSTAGTEASVAGFDGNTAAASSSETSPNNELASAQTLDTVHVTAQALRDEYAPGPSSVGAKTPTPSRDIPQTV
ncbi:MAG TPA: hypothetical protein VJ727_04195, partial [Rhodanobacteraceae bacterium]|nr:hypothetical protein [Rhodanobacteraceae bacterium]